MMPDRMDKSRLPLSSYGVQRLNSQLEAAQHCETVFEGFRNFRFSRPQDKVFLDTATIGANGFRLTAVFSSGHDIALGEQNNCGILIPLKGSIRVTGSSQQLDARAGDGIIALPGRRQTQLSPGYVGFGVFIDGPEARAKSQLTRPSSQLRAFISYLVDACDSSNFLASNPAAISSMARLLGDLVTQSILEQDTEAGLTTASAGLERHVAAAEEWIDAHAGELFPVSELASAIGVNLRTLQLAFRQHRNCTPRQAIERRRLERIRDELLRGGDDRSVTSIAMDNGVFHLGRFAASYRRMFAENPSDTLKRARY